MSYDLALPHPDLSTPLGFVDARGFKDWLKLVPMINVKQAHADVLETLDQLNKSPVFPIERLKMLELLREPVALLQDEHTRRYLGKPFPLADADEAIWRSNVKLWLAMSVGYRHTWQAALNGDISVQEHVALCGQRALRYAAQALREYHFAYRTVADARWADVYSLYQIALQAGIANKVVKDSLNKQTELSSCDAAFMQALLLAAANPSGMSVKHIQWLDRLLDKWSNQSSLGTALPDRTDKGVLVVRLDQPGELRRLAAADVGDGWLVLDIEPIGRSIRKRLKYLRNGETPLALGLGDEFSNATAQHHLSAAFQEWCDLPIERGSPRRPARVDAEPASLVSSIASTYAMIAGHGFTPPDQPTEVRGRTIADFQLFGGQARHLDAAQRGAPVDESPEQWHVDNESAQGLKLTRTEPGQRLIHNQLVAVRTQPQQPWMSAVVRWLQEGQHGEIAIGVRLLPGIPKTVAVRATGVNAQSHRFNPAIMLPAMAALNTGNALVLPVGWFKAARVLELLVDGQMRRAKLEGLLERGFDYECVSFTLA